MGVTCVDGGRCHIRQKLYVSFILDTTVSTELLVMKLTVTNLVQSMLVARRLYTFLFPHPFFSQNTRCFINRLGVVVTEYVHKQRVKIKKNGQIPASTQEMLKQRSLLLRNCIFAGEILPTRIH